MNDEIDADPIRFAELTGFQRDVMIVLADGTGVNGLELCEKLERYYDENINHGRLYPNLDTLVELGMVNKFEIDKRSNGYELTTFGAAQVSERIRWQRARFSNDDNLPDPREISTGPSVDPETSDQIPTDSTASTSASNVDNPASTEMGDGAHSDDERSSTSELVEAFMEKLRQIDDS